MLPSLMRRAWRSACPTRRAVNTCPARDQRNSYRYAGIDANEIRLGWWQDGAFQEMTGFLSDVSEGGASILLDESPPQADIWIRMEVPAATDWAEALLVRDLPTVEGLRDVGLRFLDSCPFDFFKAARGMDLTRVPEHYSPEFFGRAWR